MKMLKVAFLGSGNMAMALAKGFISSKMVLPENIWASGPHKRNHVEFEKLGCKTTINNIEAVKNSNTIFLSVKPKFIEPVLQEIKNSIITDSLIISIATGIKTDTMHKIIPNEKVIRAMPNICALNHLSTTAICTAQKINQDEMEAITKLFDSVGYTEFVDEDKMDVITALCGSGPAFVFTIIEAMADGAVRMGLSRESAIKMSANTVYGAAKTLMINGKHPAVLRDSVCSPAGTSIEGLKALEEHNLRNTLMCAIEIATKRASDLSK
ncbi:hypothetical protein A3Q56_07207 [Intoshia linei]|uniref:Pyrroline-5-carboxylate reductase n=1 Tax=Intoshia linei TaxID=1819745 RepID=A0A177ASX1_9BILA|nr:hypothetical protein A3Q56_07207 [Intoshia linei]